MGVSIEPFIGTGVQTADMRVRVILASSGGKAMIQFALTLHYFNHLDSAIASTHEVLWINPVYCARLDDEQSSSLFEGVA